MTDIIFTKKYLQNSLKKNSKTHLCNQNEQLIYRLHCTVHSIIDVNTEHTSFQEWIVFFSGLGSKLSEVYSEACETSKMERFTKIFDAF